VSVTPKFKEKYARRYFQLIERVPIRKQAMLQLKTEMRAEGVKVTERTIYNWINNFSS